MAKITQLPDYLIRQIAAGEVIAEPASVIKEAIENSLDAGASNIEVDIKNGGMTSISIADNGSGISREDLEVITTRHSTSKIKSESDLQQVLTLGFRGEFLASLLAASDLTILTKEKDEDQALKAYFQTNQKPTIEASGRITGTTLLVNNLFDKIPARRNFLPKPKTSIARIHELLRQFALAYPSKQFILKSDGKELFRSQPGSPLNALTLIFGLQASKNFISIQGTSIDQKWHVEGFISKPVEVRATRSSQYFFVNKRIIENSLIQKALEDGYKNFLAPRKFPLAVLYFAAAPTEYDANVHPAKKEIRIKDENTVYQFITDLVYTTLLQVSGVESDSIIKDYTSAELVSGNFRETQKDIIHRKKGLLLSKGQKKDKKAQEDDQNNETAKETDLFEEEEFVDIEEENPLEDGLERFYDRNEGQRGNEYFTHVIDKTELQDLEPLLQLDKTFIIASSKQHPQNLYLIDQHAVAERITLEKIIFSRKKIIKQTLLEPIILHITPSEQQVLREIYPVIEKYGYVLNLLPDFKVQITGIPVYQSRKLSQEQSKFNFREIISDNLKLLDNKAVLSNIEDDILKTLACHNSIRAGEVLSRIEMKELLKNMLQAKFPFVCCHGRPAIFKIQAINLHRLFWRI